MVKAINLVHESNFTVLLKHCNYQKTENGKWMIFGGHFLSEMDLCADAAVSRLLHDSECDSSVTHKVEDVTFYRAAEIGDIIFIKATVIELRKKAVVVEVKAELEQHAKRGRTKIASGKFVFCTKKDGKITPHELTLD